MKVYHTIMFPTFNSACLFLEQRVPVTDVSYKATSPEYAFYVGNDLVATYDEMAGEMNIYVCLNLDTRSHGELH